jgi:hypothetical protein
MHSNIPRLTVIATCRLSLTNEGSKCMLDKEEIYDFSLSFLILLNTGKDLSDDWHLIRIFYA